MKTRIFSRLIPIGRLPAAIVMAVTLCASAWGQADNNTSPAAQAAQELDNVQRLLQQSASPGGGFGSAASGDGGVGFSAMAGPSFDLEVSAGHIVKSPGDTKGPMATIGNLVSFLQEKVTNFNAIESAGVADVPLNNFKLRAVNVVTVLNILPSITDNKVQARTIVGARGRRGGQGGPGAQMFVGPGMQAGAVYMLELIPPVQPVSGAGGGGSADAAPAASDAPARQMAVFNINNYVAELARHGKSDEKAIGIELMGVETMIGDSLERLKGSPLTPDERPQFEIHYGADILIVIGSGRAIDVATKIINSLPGNGDNTGPSVPTARSSSVLFQRLDFRMKEYFMAHPENWNDYLRMNGVAVSAAMDEYGRGAQMDRESVQALQNSSSNQPGSVAPVPAPNGGP